jgi:amidophosphoribosyltransferase
MLAFPSLSQYLSSLKTCFTSGMSELVKLSSSIWKAIVIAAPKLSPCIFEYVYFARPDSIMDGVSVYESRLRMGEKLARKLLKCYPDHDIDVVIPIPDTSRTSALQAAYVLDVPFREGFIKNRYIARTFIMPGQATRKKSVRLKLNTIKSEFAGKNVLLVDDSIVRGTTAHEIVQMARDAGARKVYFSTAAPPIRYPNIYGIDIPTRHELVAYERNEKEIAAKIGCDWVLYQDLNDLEDCIKEAASKKENVSGSSGENGSRSKFQCLEQFDTSCFSGVYVTGEKIDDDYFHRLHALRNDNAKRTREGDDTGNGNSEHNKSHKKTCMAPDMKYRQHDGGCESLSNNDASLLVDATICEPIANNGNFNA